MKMKEESEKVGWKLNIQKTKIMASGPITSWQIDGETVTDFMFWGSRITADGGFSHGIKKHLLLGRKAMTNLDSILKSRDFTLPTGLFSQSYGFSNSPVWMWELDYKESWVPKNWYFWTVVLEKTLESLLDGAEIEPVHPKWDQSWIFIGKTDAGAETPILWPPDVKNWLLEKDRDAGKDWRQEEKQQRIRWLDGHQFEQTLGAGDRQESLECCSLCGCKESRYDWVNWIELIMVFCLEVTIRLT